MKSIIELNEKRVLVLMKSINGGKYINKTKFFKSIGVDPSAFNHHLNNIKIKYPEKYNEYVRINEKNRLEFIDNCEQIISIMEDMLINGVKLENGGIREFDVIDWYKIYYWYFDNADRTLISAVIESRDNKLYGKKPKAIRTRQMISSSSNQILGSYYSGITSKHILMDGSYGLTDEEKQKIIKLFDSYDIPYTYTTFDCAAKRIIKNRNNKEEDYFKLKIRVR